MTREAPFIRGDVVSCFDSHGTVIELHRRVDGKPFLMIQITDGPGAGERVFLSSGWKLGSGPADNECRDCGRRFRHQFGDDVIYCPSCTKAMDARDARQRAEPSHHASGWQQSQTRKAMRNALDAKPETR